MTHSSISAQPIKEANDESIKALVERGYILLDETPTAAIVFCPQYKTYSIYQAVPVGPARCRQTDATLLDCIKNGQHWL